MELEGKVFCFLGDSITEGHRTSAPDKAFWYQFGQHCGVTVEGYGIGGTSIALQRHTAPEEDRPFIWRYDQMRPDADVVVVFGGTNDFGHGNVPFGKVGDTEETTFCGAVYTLLYRLYERYPAAQLVLITPLHRVAEEDPLNELEYANRPLAEYVEAEKQIAAMFSVPVLDFWATSGIQPRVPVLQEDYMPDGLHPNDCGHVRMAERLEAFLRTL